jgi:prepilin-type N-terminal cleavage/methylation domain-containing protein
MTQKGFSLVELSIVLVIIGVIIGVTLKGMELVRGSELKAIVSEADEYKAAFGQFQLLYDGPPGDITNATGFWSGTANGNGNGQVDAETSNEPFRAMQQLNLAKLIDGTFSGTWGSGFVLSVPGVSGNVKPSKSARPGAAMYIKCCSGTDYSRTMSYTNHISLFSVDGTDITKRAGILTPTEARGIDDKYDDGVPDYGMIGASGSGTYSAAYVATGCYSGTGSTSTYDSAVAANKNSPNCQMQFVYEKD